MIHEHDCGFCDPGSRHTERSDGTYHRINGLLVRIGSITETRLLSRQTVTCPSDGHATHERK